jgi:hypothetical protein
MPDRLMQVAARQRRKLVQDAVFFMAVSGALAASIAAVRGVWN